jgi:hypothetical protein
VLTLIKDTLWFLSDDAIQLGETQAVAKSTGGGLREVPTV